MEVLGQTPLSMAAWNGHSSVVQQLLAAGAAVNAADGKSCGLGKVLHCLVALCEKMFGVISSKDMNPQIRSYSRVDCTERIL